MPISTVRRNYVLCMLVALYFLNFVDRQIVNILVEPMKADLGLADWQLGVISGFAFAALYATLGIPIARVADRGRRVDIIASAVALWSAMTALCGLAQNFAHLVLARIGVGVGEAGLTPPAHSIIADLFPEEQRGTAMAIYQMGVPAGALIGLMAGGFIAELWGWRVAFLAVGLPGIVVAIIVRLTVPEPARGGDTRAPGDTRGLDTRPQPPFGTSLATLWRIRSFRHITLAFSLSSFAIFAFNAWFPALLGRVHGLNTAEIAAWVGPIGFVSGVLGSFCGGFLGDRLGIDDKRWYLFVAAAGLAASIPFYVIVLFTGNATVALLVYFAPSFLGAAVMGPTFAMVQSLAPVRLRAMASSIVLFFANMIGLGLGPLAVGAASDFLLPRVGAASLAWALVLILPVLAWCAAHYVAAARTLAADLEP